MPVYAPAHLGQLSSRASGAGTWPEFRSLNSSSDIRCPGVAAAWWCSIVHPKLSVPGSPFAPSQWLVRVGSPCSWPWPSLKHLLLSALLCLPVAAPPPQRKCGDLWLRAVWCWEMGGRRWRGEPWIQPSAFTSPSPSVKVSRCEWNRRVRLGPQVHAGEVPGG